MKNLRLKELNGNGSLIQGGSFGPGRHRNVYGVPPKCLKGKAVYDFRLIRFCTPYWGLASTKMEKEDEDEYIDAYEDKGLDDAYRLL